jgi:hypothetical protein
VRRSSGASSADGGDRLRSQRRRVVGNGTIALLDRARRSRASASATKSARPSAPSSWPLLGRDNSGSRVAVRTAAFGLCESQADVAAAYRFDPIVSNKPASTRLLLGCGSFRVT